MLGRLFKYDMRALSRVLVPLHAAVLVLGALACVCGALGFGLGAAGQTSATVDVLLSIMAVTIAFGAFGMVGAIMTTFVVIIWRFYKNLFTDEGYLTLTLPVTANQIMLSKVLAGLLWLLVDALVVSACAILVTFAANGFSGVDVVNTPPFWFMNMAGGNFLGSNGPASVLMGAVGTALQGIMGLLMAYAAFTFGAAVASRHKVAAGIGTYVLASWAVGFLASILAVSGVELLSLGSAAVSPSAVSMAWSAVGMAGTVVVSGACYALCVYLLGRKVNLS